MNSEELLLALEKLVSSTMWKTQSLKIQRKNSKAGPMLYRVGDGAWDDSLKGAIENTVMRPQRH